MSGKFNASIILSRHKKNLLSQVERAQAKTDSVTNPILILLGWLFI